jgi:hypothetical protein
MKKVTSLSLSMAAAITVFATNGIAKENLIDSFKNGKISGEIKSVYSHSNFLENKKSDNITTLGGSLSYETDSFYNFKLGATFQTSHVLDDENNNNVFASDLDGSGSVLSEFYLDYKISNTTIKAGRQFIYTPLVSSAIDGKASERLIKDSFQAYLITNEDVPDTVLTAGYIDKYQAQAYDGDIGSFEDFEDGAYTIYAKNNSIENLILQAQYLKVNANDNSNDRDNIYFQADYTMGAHTFSAQYLASTDKSRISKEEDGEVYGLKASGPLGIWKLGYIVAFNSSTEDGDVDLGAGTGTTDTLFSAMPVNGGGVPARADADTLVGGIIIPIEQITSVIYIGESRKDKDEDLLGDVKAGGIMAMYSYNKNLSLKVIHEHVKTEHPLDEDTDVTRVYLSFKF